jgi:hypothetical protein
MSVNDPLTLQKSFDVIDPVFPKTSKSVALGSCDYPALDSSAISNGKLPDKKAILMPRIIFF